MGCLWEQVVPLGSGEFGMARTEARNQVVFKYPNRSFSCISSIEGVGVGEHKLISDTGRFETVNNICRVFIVEYV